MHIYGSISILYIPQSFTLLVPYLLFRFCAPKDMSTAADDEIDYKYAKQRSQAALINGMVTITVVVLIILAIIGISVLIWYLFVKPPNSVLGICNTDEDCPSGQTCANGKCST